MNDNINSSSSADAFETKHFRVMRGGPRLRGASGDAWWWQYKSDAHVLSLEEDFDVTTPEDDSGLSAERGCDYVSAKIHVAPNDELVRELISINDFMNPERRQYSNLVGDRVRSGFSKLEREDYNSHLPRRGGSYGDLTTSERAKTRKAAKAALLTRLNAPLSRRSRDSLMDELVAKARDAYLTELGEQMARARDAYSDCMTGLLCGDNEAIGQAWQAKHLGSGALIEAQAEEAALTARIDTYRKEREAVRERASVIKCAAMLAYLNEEDWSYGEGDGYIVPLAVRVAVEERLEKGEGFKESDSSRLFNL